MGAKNFNDDIDNDGYGNKNYKKQTNKYDDDNDYDNYDNRIRILLISEHWCRIRRRAPGSRSSWSP